MPILEYACHACGRHFDKLIRNVSAPLEITCPSCGASDVQRLMSAFAVSGTERRNASAMNFNMPSAASKKSAFS